MFVSAKSTLFLNANQPSGGPASPAAAPAPSANGLDPQTAALFSSLNGGASLEEAQEENGLGYEEEAEDMPDPLASLEEGEQEAPAEEQATEEKPAEPTDVEYLEVTGENGKTKVKVDWSDRESIKRAISLSVGARKWQAERDQLKSKYESVAKEAGEYKESWAQVEQAFKRDGVAGLVDLFEGRQGAYDEWRQREVDKELMRRDASPAELERLEMMERIEKLQRESSRTKQEAEAREAAAKAAEEAAVRERLEASINPAFDKVRFAGTLGDEALETRLDKGIWSDAMDQLAEIEEQYGPQAVTPALAARIFKESAESVRKAISLQSKKEAAKATEQRRVEAQTKVQAATTSAARTQTSRQADLAQFKQNLDTGNWADAFKAALTGRVKL